MAAQRHDIAIYQKYNRLPAQLPEFLHTKGFASQTAIAGQDLLRVVLQLKDPILVVDAGNNNYTAQKIAEELVEMTELQRIPLVLVGNFASDFEKFLQDHFKLTVTLDSLTSSAKIMEALDYIVDAYERVRISRDTEQKPPSAAHYQRPPPSGIHQAYFRHQTIPGLYFHELSHSGLSKIYLQGEQYLSGQINIDYLKALGFFSTDKRTLDLINRMLERCDKWSVLHLARTAFIAAQIVDSLQLEGDLTDYAVTASFLFAAGLAGKRQQQLLRANYLRPGRLEIRKDLCSRIKDSALMVGSELQSEDLTRVITGVARLVGAEQIAADDNLSIIASAIAAADLTDRLCFGSGAWDPRATHALLKRIKSGEMTEIHPQVLCCLIKFLSEAALARPWTFLLPKQVRRDPALIEQARRIRESTPSRHEVKVPLSALIPGMRLSQPLLAFDGRKILTEDLKLDADLIWRIWQLAAVRPLNSATVFYSPELLATR